MRPHPGRSVGLRLLFWAGVALLLAWLGSSSEATELYALLAVLAFGGGWALRARRGTHYCERCR